MDRQTAATFATLLVRDWRKTYGKMTNCHLMSPSGMYDSRRISDADIVRYQLDMFRRCPVYFWYWIRRVSGWVGTDNKYRDFLNACIQYMQDMHPDIHPLDIPA